MNCDPDSYRENFKLRKNEKETSHRSGRSSLWDRPKPRPAHNSTPQPSQLPQPQILNLLNFPPLNSLNAKFSTSSHASFGPFFSQSRALSARPNAHNSQQTTQLSQPPQPPQLKVLNPLNPLNLLN